ncbi:zinc finger, CCHC-type containing protein [Tanacetum coccineum]
MDQSKHTPSDLAETTTPQKQQEDDWSLQEDGRSGNKKTKNALWFGKRVDAIAWWIDSGATTHVCKDRLWFKTYEPVEDGSVLYMGFCYVYLLHAKDEALDKFRIYKTEVELQQNDLIKTLRTDKGGEYYDHVFFQSVRIIHETTAPYTPQQNGVVERKNRALKEMVNFMLFYSGLSEGFWGEAMAVVRLPDPKRKTLGEKGIDCIFVGYVEHSEAYRFYVIEPNDSVSINSIIESRDAIFDENRFSSIPRPKDIIPNSDESQRDDHFDDVPSKIPEPRKAMQSRDSAFWKEAIDDEIGSIMENNTWVLSDLPPGFRQKEGIDYFDTYAPVTRITTIRLLLSLAAIHNLVTHQMDVKTTFLNGDLDEEVYMKQPEGFVMPGQMSIRCRPDIAYQLAFKKQTCITDSTMESEFVALAAAGKEAEWLRNLIHEIPIWPETKISTNIYRCDSAPTLAKAL